MKIVQIYMLYDDGTDRIGSRNIFFKLKQYKIKKKVKNYLGTHTKGMYHPLSPTESSFFTFYKTVIGFCYYSIYSIFYLDWFLRLADRVSQKYPIKLLIRCENKDIADFINDKINATTQTHKIRCIFGSV